MRKLMPALVASLMLHVLLLPSMLKVLTRSTPFSRRMARAEVFLWKPKRVVTPKAARPKPRPKPKGPTRDAIAISAPAPHIPIALRQWRWQPALRDGQPVPSVQRVKVEFIVE